MLPLPDAITFPFSKANSNGNTCVVFSLTHCSTCRAKQAVVAIASVTPCRSLLSHLTALLASVCRFLLSDPTAPLVSQGPQYWQRPLFSFLSHPESAAMVTACVVPCLTLALSCPAERAAGATSKGRTPRSRLRPRPQTAGGRRSMPPPATPATGAPTWRRAFLPGPRPPRQSLCRRASGGARAGPCWMTASCFQRTPIQRWQRRSSGTRPRRWPGSRSEPLGSDVYGRRNCTALPDFEGGGWDGEGVIRAAMLFRIWYNVNVAKKRASRDIALPTFMGMC